ncbi:phosphatase PAP2 family protein [Neisseria shayeganii]|uniref:Phosphatidic acid phosphatase type 2/haloperoxidase domain-containing protein n=1 Tax=Neisseria shayeganii 871 TaxID=1032488 RepID=G4CIT4_9NEIS|nr:phosphatase PAP2 family protein [Neisseria shayeganii]EGY52227.1 hypothetical protein HMPREF9371_1523 [Neisseria shayeganii 871]
MPLFRLHRPTARHALLLLGMIVPLSVAVAVASLLSARGDFAFETPLMLAVHRHTAGTLLEQLALLLHWLGKWPSATLMTLCLAAYEYRQRRGGRAVLVLAGTGLSTAVTAIGKVFFDRARPELWPRLVEEASASFPSGHSAFAAAFAVLWMILYWHTPQRGKVAAVAGLLLLLAGLSRVVLGVHYPTDVLVGWMVGGVSVLGVYAVMSTGRRKQAT